MMPFYKKLLFSSCACLLLSPVAHAFVEDSDARRAILELRAQMRQSQLARAELQNQIQALQQEVANLRGMVESSQGQSLNSDASLNSVNNPQVGDPQQQQSYDQAMDLYRQGLYTQAANAFSSFSKQYTSSPLTPKAMFYEGSARYASKDYKNAIAVLNNVVSSFPNDSTAPDALLVVAAAQVELNQIKDAKQTLLRIQKFYPNTAASDTATERLKYFK
ncbi:tol-pal system protein YbgF [Basilea psittacipulmonis]|uniref:Cell division coordinator CpoB n=1 Tax=Basilea psittacipulmonis DSM 24701 TaxID=1072685 RepID=A0A077DE11_9BURK|nr:tol-pal system protein YbgF [Basilea psittacipulmonis]AIL32884.1 hypothetical protein IX83_05735 [Basilea psittacipulmonis DSM 24701]